MAHPPYRRALVTGAAGAIGRELCRLLADDGVDLVLLDRDRAGLDALRGALPPDRSVECHVVDLADSEALEATLGQIVETISPIDLVVGNAGIDRPTRVERGDWRLLREHLAINTTANAVLLSVLLPALSKERRGQFVAVASLAALVAFPYEGPYCASKAALAAWMDAARAELSGAGVDFTTLFPGFVATPMLAANAFRVKGALEPARAARIMYRAIRERRKNFYFPRRTYWKIRLALLLPLAWRERLARDAMDPDPTKLGS